MDGFWEGDLKPWDIAGGALIVAEAGGRVTNMDGSRSRRAAGTCWRPTAILHDAMLEVIRAIPESKTASSQSRSA